MVRLCFLCMCAVLPSCLTVEQDIVLKLDGSARVRMTYQVPAVYVISPKLLEEMRMKIGFTLPLTENELREYYRGTPDVTVERFTSTTGKGMYRVEATLSSARIEGLSHSPVTYTLRDLGDEKLFSITVGTIELAQPPRTAPMKRTSPAGTMLENAISVSQRGLILKFSATFPTRVLSSNGKISGRTVTWFTPYVPGGHPVNVFEARYKAAPSLWDRIRGWFDARL